MRKFPAPQAGSQKTWVASESRNSSNLRTGVAGLETSLSAWARNSSKKERADSFEDVGLGGVVLAVSASGFFRLDQLEQGAEDRDIDF